jgi:hypothetical protein
MRKTQDFIFSGSMKIKSRKLLIEIICLIIFADWPIAEHQSLGDGLFNKKLGFFKQDSITKS